MHTVKDVRFLIRDGVGWSGYGAAGVMARCAEDCDRIAAYDRQLGRPCLNRFSGEPQGGPENEALAHKAAKQYRLAAWVCRRIREGREAFLAAEEAKAHEADRARIAALPRVNAWGRPIGG
jgi:hypothetical protein